MITSASALAPSFLMSFQRKLVCKMIINTTAKERERERVEIYYFNESTVELTSSARARANAPTAPIALLPKTRDFTTQ